MGADGFIVDPDQSYDVEVRCHQCSLTVYFGEAPNRDHARCVDADGRLPVSIEINNYEER